MAAMIHPTAVVDVGAELGAGVRVGPYCIVGPGVVLGEGCELRAHVVIEGPCEIGARNVFHPFSVIGGRTQDLKYTGEPTHLRIGTDNEFRECCTVNRGTAPSEWTTVGSHNHFLAYCHIAHGCVVGDHCVFSNNGTLAGHVVVGDHVIVGGLTAVHQFCRLGAHAMLGGCTKIVQDVPPYFIADGNPAGIRGVNKVGLERRGFSGDAVRALTEAWRILYRSGLNTSQALEQLGTVSGAGPEIDELAAFIRSSTRGIIRQRGDRA
jgi:UDP-N-acetylglucosamine acyltransferase